MKRVLFVCVHNAGRSVMAEAFTNHGAAGDWEAVSAGTIPQEVPHPEVIEAMREVGIDVSTHRGRLLDDDLAASADRVVTMGCTVDEAACPSLFLKQVDDWGLPDPKGQTMERVREIRDEIHRRVNDLLESSGDSRGT